MAKFYSDVEEMTKRMKQAMPPPDALLLEQRPEIIEIFALAACRLVYVDRAPQNSS